MSRAVGADIGGTWVSAVLLENDRRPRRARVALAGRTPARTLEALLRGWGLVRADALVAGAKGAGGRVAPPHWRRDFSRLTRRLVVTGDLELARDAAFGGGPGVLLIAGTGSAALAVGPRGRTGRAGGRGPLLGDEGSGFWLGRRWLDGRGDPEAMRYARRPDVVAAVSSLAPGVLRRARRGARAERALAEEAARHLAALAERAARGLFPGTVPLCLHGGLAADRWFKALLLRRLGRRFRLAPPTETPEAYAARRAVELLSSRK
ncbi:MAG: hypothetical protein HYZ75_09070 [Elusimicrobia bacterium]|nr:hypothetical protein [Elusimicrobiota bacterium]